MRVPFLRSVAVFAGPSLPPSDRVEAQGVTYLPPASRGDVGRAASDYDAVLLIDGVFHHDLAPSPKECCGATCRARMFGAASMGALRAAECEPFGFTALGAIARWYASGTIDGDDEVAVLEHAERHESLSVPMVNVRYVARLARKRGMLTAAQSLRIIEGARAIFYMDRAWQDVLELAPDHARGAVAKIAATQGDLKRLDARFALRRVLRWQRENSRGIELPAHVPRVAGAHDRSIPPEKTLELLPELRRRYGITRVADTTLLDRTGIPTFSAMVPRSPDLLGVYNGKGATREAAMASAVMEAVERQVAAAGRLPVFRESLRAVGESIDLAACGLRDGVAGETVDCVLGTDLLGGGAIAVPLALVQCPWFGEKLFDMTSSNGLASGNNLTEALYHAFCEVIERHTWSMYQVRCSLAPRYFLGPDAPERALAPEIELPCGDERIDELVRAIRASGLAVRAIALPEPPLPLTAIASITERGAPIPMAHMGLGCALSPAHALTRALTEAVQSRVVDIQAAREDLLRPDEPRGAMGEHGRRLDRLPANRWYYDLPGERTALADLASRSGADLADDLRRTLDALARYGISRAIAVDLSPDDLPIAVVRVIVPELDTYVLTGRLGARARALLNPFALAAS